MSDLTDNRIKQILKSYNNKRLKEKERYEKIKDNEDFKLSNRERAKNHYHKNKDIKLNKYKENKDFFIAKSSYYYYKKNNRLNEFKEKYPQKIEVLNINKFKIIDS